MRIDVFNHIYPKIFFDKMMEFLISLEKASIVTCGYAGNIEWIDLTKGSAKVRNLEGKITKKSLGGKACF